MFIFYLWKDAQGEEHGLIVAPTDQSSGHIWSNISDEIGPAAQSSWNGLSNSLAIVAQAGHESSAAKLCLDLESGGYSDWYLPAIDELSLLWHSRFIVNKSLSTIGGATVLPYLTGYWSSTEIDYQYSLYFTFSFLVSPYYGYDYIKYSSIYNVRAIRAF